MLKKIVIAAALMVASAAHSYAQSDPVSVFSEKVASSCVSFGYEFTVKTATAVTGRGTVVFQDDSYRMNGNGLDIWCDGHTRWTLDHSSKEAYVESVEASSVDYVSSPALLIRSVGEVFTKSSSAASKFNGKSATAVTLLPSMPGTGLKSVVLYFYSGSVPCGASIVLSDGTVTDITLKDFKFSAISGQSFTYDVSSLDKSWLVLDLR